MPGGTNSLFWMVEGRRGPCHPGGLGQDPASEDGSVLGSGSIRWRLRPSPLARHSIKGDAPHRFLTDRSWLPGTQGRERAEARLARDANREMAFPVSPSGATPGRMPMSATALSPDGGDSMFLQKPFLTGSTGEQGQRNACKSKQIDELKGAPGDPGEFQSPGGRKGLRNLDRREMGLCAMNVPCIKGP